MDCLRRVAVRDGGGGGSGWPSSSSGLIVADDDEGSVNDECGELSFLIAVCAERPTRIPHFCVFRALSPSLCILPLGRGRHARAHTSRSTAMFLETRPNPPARSPPGAPPAEFTPPMRHPSFICFLLN